ncbi:MAG: hypothetical protein NTV70_24825 [Acidobacteria bacterium]|nr:hypothetical protein [Acidobacteriota bacterium]
MINLYIALALYASLAAVAGAALWGYLHLSREIALLKRRIAPAPGLAAQAAPAAPAKPVRAVNQDARAQILRMDRQGEASPTIAAATGVPQAEVELTLKLDRIRSARA